MFSVKLGKEAARMTKRAFVLWKLELKRTIRQLPVILAEAVLLLSILGMIAFGAAKLLYRDVPAIRITIAVIEKEKNPLTDLLLNYIQGMESISELCQFLIVSEEGRKRKALPCCRREKLPLRSFCRRAW